MSFSGLDFQPVHLPLAAGLNQKVDARALQPPELARCVDVQFDEVGGLQTRYPYALTTLATTDGGTVTNPRRIVENGSELLLFSKDSLYSWNAQLSKWARKGTHLAVKIGEVSRFVTTGDQVDCDRAELNGLVVYAWTDNNVVYAAASDKTTGSVVVAPTNMTGGATMNRARLVALATKILLFVNNDTSGYVEVTIIDPANPTGTIAAGRNTQIGSASHSDYYDVVRIAGADQAAMVQRLAPTTSYQITTYTAGGVQATSTKARTCDGPIAVSSDPTGAELAVIRADASAIQADRIVASSLADTSSGTTIGTGVPPIGRIAAAHRSTQDAGQYRCYAFWTDGESDSNATWEVNYGWIDTGGASGTLGRFIKRTGIASRAFSHNGRVYLWMSFSGASFSTGAGATQLQNSYFLYRDDGLLIAKAAATRAGGRPSSIGWLPGVSADSSDSDVYHWCGTERRILELGGAGTGYGARAPREITSTFDSNEARRCVRLGQTLYISGGEILQYDGVGLYEVGFHVFPWYFRHIETPAGNLADGSYAYKETWRWDNARGELDRSTTATTGVRTIAAGPNGTSIDYSIPLYNTHKGNALAMEVWRTAVNPNDDSPFYLVTSKDPASAANPNRYVSNDTTADQLAVFNDELADAGATLKETHYENGGILENLAPPAASIIAATDERLFLAGVAGDADRVWYSKRRSDGEVASFHDTLVVNVPPVGGEITALGFLNESPVVFREHAIYALLGDGFDNAGTGQNFVARAVPGDVGAVNQESVAATERGLVFKSSKGWYLLNRAYALEYIGAAVSDYDNETPLAVHAVESQHQIRILTSARMIVVDTLLETWRWGEWSISDGVHACMWNGSHVYLSAAGPKVQQTSYVGVDYGMDVETSWIKLADLQGFGCVDQLQILGEYRSAHTLQVRLARDYWKDGVDTYFQSKTHTPSGLVAGQPLRLKHGPTIRQMQALKVRLTASPTAAGESLKLTGLSLELGMRRGLNRHLPTAQKQ